MRSLVRGASIAGFALMTAGIGAACSSFSGSDSPAPAAGDGAASATGDGAASATGDGAASAPDGGNLLTNGAFENGCSGLSAMGSIITAVSPGRNGSAGACQICFTSTAAGGYFNVDYAGPISQQQLTYSASAWVRAAPDAGAPPVVKLRIQEAPGVTSAFSNASVFLAPTDWVNVQVDFQPSTVDGGVGLPMDVYLHAGPLGDAGGPPSCYQVDDLSITVK